MKALIAVLSIAAVVAIGDSVGVRFPVNAEMKSNKGQPNGYAGLDEEGKIDADIIEIIVVEFAGGEAVDVE